VPTFPYVQNTAPPKTCTTHHSFAVTDRGNRRAVAELRPGRDDEIVERLPAGSMRPKVEAAFRFVRETGGQALITSAEALEKGEAGTRIVPASAT